MAPLIERIAWCPLDRADIGTELLVWLAVAGDQALRHALRTHQAPLVMVASAIVEEPQLGQILEVHILDDLGRIEMTVVVDDGLAFCMPMEELSGPLGIEQEIIVHEHGDHASLARAASFSSVSQMPLM